jgi:tetratricopeptide (TPR) repeat protein
MKLNPHEIMRTSPYPTILLAIAILAAGSGCSRLSSKARKLAQADRQYQAGQYDQAEIGYMNVLKKDPRNVRAIGQLALIYVEQGRFMRASPFLLRCREIAPDNLDVRAKLAGAYLAMGQFKEAKEEATYVLDHRPGEEEALYVLVDAARTDKDVAETRQRLDGWLQKAGETAPIRVALGLLDLRREDLPAAEEAFQRALKLDPKSAAANLALFAVCLAKNDPAQAEAALQKAAELSPPRSPKRLQYAKFKIQSGDLKEGRRLLEAMVKAAPDYVPALGALAEMNLNEKKLEACADLVKRMSARDPGNETARFLEGRLKMEKGDAAGAIKEFSQLISMQPNYEPAHYCLALAYLAANEPSKCEASLAQAMRLNPEDAAATMLLSELQIRKGDFAQAIVSLKTLIQKQPQVGPAYFLLANAYLAQKNYDEALRVLEDLKRMFPKNAEPFMMSGSIALQQKKKDDARRDFEKGLELAPHDPRVVEQLVNLDLMDKQYAAALQRVEKEMDPKLAPTQVLMAKVYAAQQDYKSAEAALKKALEIQPEAQGIYMLLSQLYLSSKQEKSAVDTLESAVKKNPKDAGALLLLGMIREQQKGYDAARDAYQKVLAVNPNSGVALNNLAVLLSERFGKLDEALTMARKLRDLNPKDPLAADTLGWILFKKGQCASALSLLQESAASLPSNAEIQFHLGMVEYMMGHEEAARAALQRALELDKKLAGREEAARCLAVLAADAQGAEARKTLEKQLAEHPDDPVASLRLAMGLEREGAFAKAASLYERALKANPENVRVLVRLAELQADRLNNVPKGMELAGAAYKLAPTDPEVSHALGRLAYRANNFKWAFSLLQETARRETESGETLYDLAEAAYSMGRVTDAVSAMKGALAAKPPCSRADAARRFLDLVDGPADASRTGKAEQELKVDPNHVPALMLTAALAERKGNAAQAAQSYEKALARFPDFVPAKKRLAILCARDSANNPKAFDLASEAHEALPGDLELTRAFGTIAYRKGDYARAASLFLEVVGKEPGPEAIYYLGMSQYRMKKTAESRKSLQRALEMNLSGDLAAEAKKVLAELK